jgi:lipid-A-disaccharide synthase-like uncharacterized protein
MTAASQISGDLDLPKVSATRWWTVIAALLLLVYELGWVIPWFQSMMNVSVPPDPLLSVMLLGGMLILSCLLAYCMEVLHLLRQVQLGLLGVLLLTGLAIGEWLLWVPGEMELSKGLVNLDIGVLVIAGYIFFVWYRGFSLAYGGVRPVVVWKRFRLGLVAMMVYIFFVINWKAPTPSLGYAMAFLFVGLFALIMTRLAYVGMVRGGQKNPYDRRWFMGVLGALALVILISGFMGSLLSGQYAWVLDLVNKVVDWIQVLFLIIIGVPAVIVTLILWPLVKLLNAFLAGQPINPRTLDTSYPNPYIYPIEEPAGSTPPVVIYLTALCFWGGLAILAVFLYIRARRAWLASYASEPEEPEGILEQGEARRLLRQAVQDAWDGLLDRLHPVQRRLAAARIRRIYQELMDLCETRNLPRQPARTPLEFLPEMATIFPEGNDDLEIITHAYIRVRYGEYPESIEEVDVVEAAWTRVNELAKLSEPAHPRTGG